jgi:hypothetical protein
MCLLSNCILLSITPPKHKREIAQCANCQRYGHTKNYCHLKPRCVKCAGDHLTKKYHQKEISTDVRCVLCGGNHPVNYKGYTVYKDLQKKTYTPLFETIHSSCTNQTNITHSTRSNICSNKKKLHCLSPRTNYTDRATAACRRSDCQLVRIEGATWSA